MNDILKTVVIGVAVAVISGLVSDYLRDNPDLDNPVAILIDETGETISGDPWGGIE